MNAGQRSPCETFAFVHIIHLRINDAMRRHKENICTEPPSLPSHSRRPADGDLTIRESRVKLSDCRDS